MSQSAVETILSLANTLSPAERKALLDALMRTATEHATSRGCAWGKYAGLVTPVDEFLTLKHEATALEDKRTQR